jgi:hypothetical protein
MTWDIVGAWMNGEGSFSTHYVGRSLRAHVVLSQDNQRIGGYKILTEIRDFIRDQLGIEGVIHPKERRVGHLNLRYLKIMNSYKLTAVLLPYLRHPTKIRDAIALLAEVENHTKRTLTYYQQKLLTAKPEEKGYITRIIKTQQKRLAQIQKIKQEYPYIQKLFTTP